MYEVRLNVKRKIIEIIIIFGFQLNYIFSQEVKFGVQYNYPSEYGVLIINDDSYTMKSLDGKEGIKEETFKSKIEYKNNFKWLQNLDNPKNKYLILSCSYDDLEFLTLVCSRDTSENNYKNWEIYYNYHPDYKKLGRMPLLRGFDVIKADSFLTESLKNGKEIKYLPSVTSISNNPWAVKNNSAKKIIYLEPYSSLHDNKIIIANGFICVDKPYLYEQNSRAKKIKITWNSGSKEFELQDTPNFQIITLPCEEDAYDGILQIEIMDAYLGSKYTDIVISGIYYIE